MIRENLNEFFNRFKSLIDYTKRLDESDREMVVDSLNAYLNSDSELFKKTSLLLSNIKDNMSFEEVDGILHEFLNPHIAAFFLMPKPRKLSYRLDPNLEYHLLRR